MHKKPSGINGVVSLSLRVGPEFQKIILPNEKSKLEAIIFDSALKVAEGMHPPFYNLSGKPIANLENNFDYSLPIAGGVEYLDLAEITLGMESGGYIKAPSSHLVGDLVDAVWKVIQKKEDKYGDARRAVVHLLLYVTDWKFLLSPSCIRLLAFYCAKRKHEFKSIAYFVPVSMGDGIFTSCYPSSDELFISQLEEVNIRNSQLLQGNPETILPTENGAGVIFRF
ncbi:hypothetical protein G6727_08415 [Polynucleobacter paneuropaeus]|jgi:hypothetical protein|nr:hypothetical protein [Polynucleobacter paneuropaeus]